MAEFSRVGDYLKRVSRQLGRDLKREVAGIVIALLAIIAMLIIQFEMGWIKQGEGWPTVFINIVPYLIVFLLYFVYHLVRAPYELDKQLGEERDSLKSEVDRLTEPSSYLR